VFKAHRLLYHSTLGLRVIKKKKKKKKKKIATVEVLLSGKVAPQTCTLHPTPYTLHLEP